MAHNDCSNGGNTETWHFLIMMALFQLIGLTCLVTGDRKMRK